MFTRGRHVLSSEAWISGGTKVSCHKFCPGLGAFWLDQTAWLRTWAIHGSGNHGFAVGKWFCICTSAFINVWRNFFILFLVFSWWREIWMKQSINLHCRFSQLLLFKNREFRIQIVRCCLFCISKNKKWW